MAAADSMDLRTRVLKDSDAGLSSKALAEPVSRRSRMGGCAEAAEAENGCVRPDQANQVSAPRDDAGRVGSTGRARCRPPGRDAGRAARGVADGGGHDHHLAGGQSAGSNLQTNHCTPTSTDDRTSPLTAGGGATVSGCGMLATISSSMNAASPPICCVGTAAVLAASDYAI